MKVKCTWNDPSAPEVVHLYKAIDSGALDKELNYQ